MRFKSQKCFYFCYLQKWNWILYFRNSSKVSVIKITKGKKRNAKVFGYDDIQKMKRKQMEKLWNKPPDEMSSFTLQNNFVKFLATFFTTTIKYTLLNCSHVSFLLTRFFFFSVSFIYIYFVLLNLYNNTPLPN